MPTRSPAPRRAGTAPALTPPGEQAGHAPDEEEDGADEAQLLQQHLPPLANFPQQRQHGLRARERRSVQLHGRRGAGRRLAACGAQSRRLSADGSMAGGRQRGAKPVPGEAGRQAEAGGKAARRGGEAALSGAGLSPAARAHHGRRRRKRSGGRPAAGCESAPSNGGSARARPAKFQAESFPRSVPPSFHPSAPAGRSKRRLGTGRPLGSRSGAEQPLNRSRLPLPRAPGPARPSPATFWALRGRPWQRATAPGFPREGRGIGWPN